MKHNKTLFLILVILLTLLFLTVIIYSNKEKTVKEKLTDEDIRKELKNLEKINVYPENKKINVGDYPKVVGKYSKNNLNLIEIYYCSDLCPDYGNVYLVFENISKEECSKIGGEEVNAVFPPEYLGCKPKINVTDEEISDKDNKIDENNKDSEKDKECFTDEDCIPFQCCHPYTCVAKENAQDCSGIFCTQECKPGTLDCNHGYCSCISGRCQAVFK